MPTRRVFRLPWLVLIASCALALSPSGALSADGVVGTGSAASCTETAFDTALNVVETSGGGTITFNCGPAPHTIIFSAQKSISADTTIRGGDRVTLSGGNATGLFQVFVDRSLTISNITLTRGHGPSGAIENFGLLTIVSSQVLSSTTTGSGGAITNYGDLVLTNALIANNSADDLGGGIYTLAGTTAITGSQFSNNTALNGGGGIAATSATTLTVTASQFSLNKTTGTLAEGGAIRSSGTFTLTNSTFARNNASRGGGLFVESGSADVTNSTFSGNWAAYGGGIRQEGGALALTDVTLNGNGYSANGSRVTTGGGAISWEGGSATLTDVTISGNWASYGGGFDHATGTTALINVTISGNDAVGGGGFDQGGGSIVLTNVTISDNSAPFFAAGIASRNGTITLKNTLLARNLNLDNNQGFNCNKTLGAGSFSMSSDSTCGFGTGRDNADVRIGPLANNGGVTQTHLLGRGSVAIDGGTGSGCPQIDQRGVSRPQGQACDVGAVEITPADLLRKVYLSLMRR